MSNGTQEQRRRPHHNEDRVIRRGEQVASTDFPGVDVIGEPDPASPGHPTRPRAAPPPPAGRIKSGPLAEPSRAMMRRPYSARHQPNRLSLTPGRMAGYEPCGPRRWPGGWPVFPPASLRPASRGGGGRWAAAPSSCAPWPASRARSAAQAAHGEAIGPGQSARPGLTI
jgi:hypothetical protein